MGALTQTQTEDNFEIEYTISNSCTPDSRNTSAHIKRRINFDDASGETNGQARGSEINNNTKFITSFTLKFDGGNANDSNNFVIKKISNPS